MGVEKLVDAFIEDNAQSVENALQTAESIGNAIARIGSMWVESPYNPNNLVLPRFNNPAAAQAAVGLLPGGSLINTAANAINKYSGHDPTQSISKGGKPKPPEMSTALTKYEVLSFRKFWNTIRYYGKKALEDFSLLFKEFYGPPYSRHAVHQRRSLTPSNY